MWLSSHEIFIKRRVRCVERLSDAKFADVLWSDVAKHFSAFVIEEISRDCCFRGWPENITGVAGLQMCCHRLNHLANTQNSLDKSIQASKTKN